MADSVPKNVRRFAWLYWTSALIIILGEPIAWLQESPANRIIAAVEGAAVYTALVLAIFLPLFWLTVWKRRNWSRWALLLAFAASLPLSFVDWHGMRLPLTTITLGVLSDLVEALAFYFLFTGTRSRGLVQNLPQKVRARQFQTVPLPGIW
jgi:prepilin signal peptidase PulO-like enzyme (type II secretory pathway)